MKSCSKVSWVEILGALFLLIMPSALGIAGDSSAQRRFDLLIVAPHSDDEAIGCTGVILRAIAAKQRVGVVVVSAGDGFPKAAAAAAGKQIDALVAKDFVALAAMRQRHSVNAMTRLGIEAGDLLFLGYPDGGLATMYNAQDEAPYRQPHTGKSETYGPLVADYHTRTHVQSAAYTRKALLADLVEIFQAFQPREIFVTGEADGHADHRATFWYVRDAAQSAKYEGKLWTFIVHGLPPAEQPERILTLSAGELRTKRTILEMYQVGVSPVHDRLADTYATPDERFWLARYDKAP